MPLPRAFASARPAPSSEKTTGGKKQGSVFGGEETLAKEKESNEKKPHSIPIECALNDRWRIRWVTIVTAMAWNSSRPGGVRLAASGDGVFQPMQPLTTISYRG
jgi:hypothetical protein